MHIRVREILFIGLFSATSIIHAQSVAQFLDESDIIVVADTVRMIDSGVGTFRTVGDPDSSASRPVVRVELDVVYAIKGNATGRITICLPKWSVEGTSAGGSGVGPRYHVVPGKRNLWCLRKRGKAGFPCESDQFGTGVYSRTWHPDTGELAPTFLNEGPGETSCSNLYQGTGNSVFSKMCEVAAFNLKANGDRVKRDGAGLLWFLNPQAIYRSDSYENDRARFGKDANEFRDRRISQILDFAIPAQHVLALGIQIEWGKYELSEQFTQLFMKQKYADLAGIFPQRLRLEDKISLLRHPDPEAVSVVMGQLSGSKSVKAEITKIAVTRFGETRRLDVALLGALSSLWDRKDLSPHDERGQYKSDLSLEIYMAKRLTDMLN